MRHLRVSPILAAALLFLPACSAQGSPAPDSTGIPSLSPTQTATVTFTAVPSTTAAPTASTINTNPQLLALVDPQGIIFDADGNLIVTDAGNHRLIKLVIR